jgi:alpha-L-fucosidase 2
VTQPETLDLFLQGNVQDDGLRFRIAGLKSSLRRKTFSRMLRASRLRGVTGHAVVGGGHQLQKLRGHFGRSGGTVFRDFAENFPTQVYDEIRASHVADHQKLFRRVSLDLGRTPKADLPTNERQSQLKASPLENDPALAALHFQYGRYLLIASSRPGSQPANLQGVWNEELNPPWESKYTLNINAEMNYWPAEVCNLSETHEPFFDLIDDLTISGARAAQKQYGARGWVVHHNTDLWRGAAPINNVDGFWPTGGAWLCHHLWEHYLFTGDKNFSEAARLSRDESASLFFVDFLIKDPKTGYLVTSPSHSPEQTPPNRPLFSPGPTMDNQLIRALFTYTIEAAEILGTDQKFAKQLD